MKMLKYLIMLPAFLVLTISEAPTLKADNFDGSICVADYYNPVRRPFVIDCYGMIEAEETFEMLWTVIKGYHRTEK